MHCIICCSIYKNIYEGFEIYGLYSILSIHMRDDVRYYTTFSRIHIVLIYIYIYLTHIYE